MLSKKQKQAEGAALILQLNRDNLKRKLPANRPASQRKRSRLLVRRQT
jgi:hypothetical protein